MNANTAQPELNLGVLLSKHPELQIEHTEYNINVTANYGTTMSSEEVLQRYIAHDGAGKSTHLYFHLPFCSYVCHFCNYVKQLLPENDQKEATLEKWTDFLIKESQMYLDRVPWLREAKIESFFIGGGTASLLRKKQLTRLLDHVRQNYQLTDDCELTLEGNPDNYQNNELQDALEVGFNRFSLGVQSFQDEVNKFVGRKHDGRMSLEAIKNLLATGRPFNVDMMFGLPHQTVETVEKDIRTLCELGVPTITIYRLRNADRQDMGIGNRSAWNIPQVRERIESQGLFPSLEKTYEMREAALKVLLEFGYAPSPCGWWSKPGTYPDGNIPRVSRNKWQRYDTMIAYGPGVYGWITGGTMEVLQTHNMIDINEYAKHMENATTPPLAYGRLLTDHEAVASTLGFAFKANQKIELERFKKQFGVEILKDEPYKQVFTELLSKGLMEMVNDGTAIKPTLDGEALHEEIISVYIHGRIGSFAEAICRRF